MKSFENFESEMAMNNMKYPKPKCRIPGCGNNCQAFNDRLCYAHTPNNQNKEVRCCEKKHCERCGSVDYFQDIADGFWSLCEWNGDCYEWQATQTKKGYGVITLKGRQWKAHRVAKALSGEFVPHWLVIDHLCRNTSCVNPAHLRVCTNAVNVLAGESPIAQNKKKTHCPKGHPYDIYGNRTKPRKGVGNYWRACLRCQIKTDDILKARLKELNYE